MSVPTAPVPGEHYGFGSVAGPNPYVPGAGNGFLLQVPTLFAVTRVISLRERSGALTCRVETAVAGDMPNEVRVRVFTPRAGMTQATVRTSLRAGAAAPADHAAVDIQGAMPIDNHLALGVQNALGATDHTHTITLAADANAPNVVATLGVLGVAAGAAPVTGIQNATMVYGVGLALAHTFGAGAPVVHAAWDGVANVAAGPAGEAGAIDLSTYTFDVETAGF